MQESPAHFPQTALGRRRFHLIGAALAMASFAVSAQGQHDAYLKSLYDKAIASGESTLVIYNPFTAPNKVVYEEFEKQFPGIRIRGVEMFGPQLISRVEAEAATGRMQSDLLYVNAADALALHKLGRLTSFVPETARGLPEQYVGMNQQWADWTLTVGGIYYNKNRVKAADAPKGYADLLDPKWSGRVTTVTFRVPGGAAQGVTALVRDKSVGEDWIHKFAANKPFVVATSLFSR